MSNHWRDDIVAGFIVFLIALPLSIGIAIAAGAPASSGILSAIIGGILGSLITGTHISITGPAAGLIVVIGGAIVSLSDGGDMLLGFKRTLAAVIISGALQILLGLFRLGKLTFLAPLSVVNGMLAAIGTIIMIKQVPVILGAQSSAKSILGLVMDFPNLIMGLDLPILLIGFLCMVILILWKYLPTSLGKVIPAPLAAVSIGLALSYVLEIDYPHNVNWFNFEFHLGPEFLVHVPSSIRDLLIFPKFDIAFTGRSLISIMTIFLVGSLESLLSAYAVDKLDPYKRKSDLDFDIIGKGITNMCCGALGAYPVITEIVRSSANITNGAKTKWANFFHGLFILVFVALFPVILNHIPLSALAAILFFVGLNLAHPRHFVAVWNQGKEQFLFFTLTLVVTLVEDLLVGVAVGIFAKTLHHLIKGVKFKDFFSPNVDLRIESDECVLSFHGPVVFLGYLKIKGLLDQIGVDQCLKIETNDNFVDFTILELLKDFVDQKKA